MTREQCERKLLDLMEEAYDLFSRMHNGNHLSMFATDDGCCVMGYTDVAGRQVNVIDGFKSADGFYRISGKE